MNKVVEINNLSKKYGKIQALDNMSFSLEPGKIYGLLGRNGAGKTTLLNLLTSRIYTKDGEITLFGHPGIDNQSALARICYMPEKNLFPESMRVHAILRTAASFYPAYDESYANELCRLFGLDVRRKYKALSRGYESILRIVMGLASRTDLTIFDEPILGLDAAARDLFYQSLVREAADHPRTFILSTHLIDESADLFEDVIILKEGRLVAFEPADALRRTACQISGRTDIIKKFIADNNLTALGCESLGNLSSCIIRGMADTGIRRLVEEAGLDITPVSLQKLFIYMTESVARRDAL